MSAIFADPSGRRWRIVRCLLVGLACVAWTLAADLTSSDLPPLPASPVAAAFYDDDVEGAWTSWQAHRGRISHLMPLWLTLRADGTLDDTRLRCSRLLGCTGETPVLAVLQNPGFDVTPLRQLLRARGRHRGFAIALRDCLLAHRLQGVNVDFEGVRACDRDDLTHLMREVGDLLHAAHLMVTQDVQAVGDDYGFDLARLGRINDFLVLMAYDEHEASSGPGPICSEAWLARQWAFTAARVPPDRLVLGVGSYAYDWSEAGCIERTAPAAARLCPGRGPHRPYVDTRGHRHDMWLLDADTAAAARRLCANARGTALWSLGTEDSRIWTPRVAMTFDDGPDPATTPAILDILARGRVAATFFVVGQNALRCPDLLRREGDEGHQIASHTFTHPDLSRCGPWRTNLELDLTQCVIASITGHGALALRLPYQTPAPVMADYVTVGATVDPRDWAEGADPVRIADHVAAAAVDGSVVLLHDGGGNRQATIDALPGLIARLRRRGFEFVTVAELLGLPKSALNPPLVSDRAHRISQLLEGGRAALQGFGLLLLGGMTVGIGRTVLVLILSGTRAVDHRPPWRPATVVIAARNEAPTIAAAVRSALDGGAAEVIVVDDGSSDGTPHVIDACFSGDPRVRCLSQALSAGDNRRAEVAGGKAAALNRGFVDARHSIVIGMDADTIVAPAAIDRLASAFDDPTVGAVAGRIEVHHPSSALTRWQAVEYAAAQSIERRAWSRLNAIAVVPGALGAWRRDAVLALGGFAGDTLTEDTDLTWRLRAAGWRLLDAPSAVAWTEPPRTLRALFRQRLRWTFGTMQSLWKHRHMMGHHGWLGRVVLPLAWLQLLSQAMAPLVDGVVLATLIGAMQCPHDPPRLTPLLAGLGAQALLAVAAGLVAIGRDGRPLRDLATLLVQRAIWHVLLAAVSARALGLALRGTPPAWDSPDRIVLLADPVHAVHLQQPAAETDVPFDVPVVLDEVRLDEHVVDVLGARPLGVELEHAPLVGNPPGQAVLGRRRELDHPQ